MRNGRRRKGADNDRQRGRLWRGGRVELQSRFFIVWGLRQHAEPDGMALVRPLKGNMGAVIITGSDVLRSPVERPPAAENGLERLYIQGESWYHDGPIMCSADEFDGCGIDDEFHELLIFMIPPSQRPHRTVVLHAVRPPLNQPYHPS